jgi:hypothetical protein
MEKVGKGVSTNHRTSFQQATYPLGSYRHQNMKTWSGEASVQRFQFDLFALKVVSLSFLTKPGYTKLARERTQLVVSLSQV